MNDNRLYCKKCESVIRFVATDSVERDGHTEITFSQGCDCYTHIEREDYPEYWPV